MKWKTAGPSEYLAITGWGIPDIKLAKKEWIFPGQKCTKFDVSPVNYTFEVQAMSAEKLPFILPAVFTIGPRVTDMDSLLLYAKLISPHDKLSNHVKELVQGVIEGETRVLAASMTMEQVFKGTKEFKKEVFEKVQLELDQFGLLIYNANVKQLVDVPGHEYFSYLGQKTQMEAANQAKVYKFCFDFAPFICYNFSLSHTHTHTHTHNILSFFGFVCEITVLNYYKYY